MKTKFRLQKIARYFLYTLLAVVLLQSCTSRTDRIKDALKIHPNCKVIKAENSIHDFILIDTLNNRTIFVKDGTKFIYINNR